MRKIALALAFIAAATPSLAEDCVLKTYGTIPFETDETGHIYVPASFAGRQTRLLLDTGSYWSTIRKDLGASLGLRLQTAHSLNLVDLAGDKIKQVAVVPDVKIGSIALGSVEFFATNPAEGTSFDEEGGLLGQNILNVIDLEIDNAGKRITFFSQDHCEGDGVYWADEAVTLKYKRAPARAQPARALDANRIKPRSTLRSCGPT